MGNFIFKRIIVRNLFRGGLRASVLEHEPPKVGLSSQGRVVRFVACFPFRASTAQVVFS